MEALDDHHQKSEKRQIMTSKIKMILVISAMIFLVPVVYAAERAQLRVVPESTAVMRLSVGATSTVTYTVTANALIQNIRVSPSSAQYLLPSYITASVSGSCLGATLATGGSCQFTLSLVTTAGHVGQSFTLAPRVSGNNGGTNSTPSTDNRILVRISNPPPVYSVTPSAGANGSISPSTTQTVSSGSNSPVFTATPAVGYLVGGWTVDGSGYSACGANTSCSLANVTANHTIAVGFSTVAALSVIEPSLMFFATASNGTLGYRGILTVKNTGGSTAGGVPIATLSSGSGFTQLDTTCHSALASNATCTFTFAVTPPVVTSATVTISDGVVADGSIVEPTSAMSVTAFSPPVNATHDAALMLVAGCSSMPEVLQVTNLSSATISGITATAPAAKWTSLRNPLITNGCSGVSLMGVGDVCSLSVIPNGSAVSGDNGTIEVGGINTNTVGIIGAVEAANAIPTAVVLGGALPGTSPDEMVFSLDQACNLVKVGASSDQGSIMPWDPSSNPIATTGSSTDGNLGQSQSVLAIHTIGFLENGGTGTPAANYAAGLCTPSQLSENNAVNWYLPSIGSNAAAGGIDPLTMAAGGDELGLVLYYAVNSSNANTTATYWSATEFNSDIALTEVFDAGDESRRGEVKSDFSPFFVRCARALTY